MSPRRVESLADGVFAVAMVLLVLGVRVPEVAEPAAGKAFVVALFNLLPAVGSYALSFLILGMLWIGHHGQLHLVRRVNRAFLWITVLYLLVVAFIPFATAFLARYPGHAAGTLVYGGVLVLAGLTQFLQWGYAVNHELVVEEVTPEAAEQVRERIAMGIAIWLLATNVGAFLPRIGLVIFACVPVAYMLPTRVDPRLVEEASEGE